MPLASPWSRLCLGTSPRVSLTPTAAAISLPRAGSRRVADCTALDLGTACTGSEVRWNSGFYHGVPAGHLWRRTMTNNETTRGRTQDRARVAGGQQHEVKYEAGKTGASKTEVRETVKEV